MNALTLVAASRFDHAALTAIFNESYVGYEIPTHLDVATFSLMAKLTDYDLERSVVALDGERPAGFAMLALRGANAWIGGMGVAPAFRGRGLGAEMMRAVITNARAAGVRAVDLEVLVGNTHAIRIYEALGFGPVRKLVVWLIEATANRPPVEDPESLVPLDHAAALRSIGEWVRDPAPWQRAPETIANFAERPAALGCLRNGAVAGAVVYRAFPDRVSILAIGANGAQPQEMLEALIEGVLSEHPGLPQRLLNLPGGDPAEPVFERLGARAEARQIHMRLSL